MNIRNKFISKRLLFSFLLLFTIIFLSFSVYLFTIHPHTENDKFQAFTTKLFKEILSGNTLNLHYSIAYPDKADIHTIEATLGRISPDRTELYETYKNHEKTLNSFKYSQLSTSNQRILDTLLLNYRTEQLISNCWLLEEYLSPSLGVQAQLPVLLAEYTFRCQQDIIDYLKLLQDIGPYFDSIMDFEHIKSREGLFMCDETVDRIQEQCQAFIQNPNSNFLLTTFSDKINEFSSISDEEKRELLTLHKQIVTKEVIPAYKKLISDLQTLYGTGQSPAGLYHFPNGTTYYQYLLQSNAGIYDPIPQIEYRLIKQLYQDTQILNQLIETNPDIIQDYTNPATVSPLTADEMLAFLIDIFQQDFPAPICTDYEVCYVHQSMEEHLSPAFYLTPPLDTGTPNTIYLNTASLLTPLETFTTLAHEGYPGHLYQTTNFTAENANPILHLFASNGYVEGWATYIESYAYQYAASALKLDSALTKLAYLNRSTTLCLYSLLDIGIHYRGWTENDVSSFLQTFGISDTKAVHEIFLYIVENPGNYLQYYYGNLKFLDLKNSQQLQHGNDFSLKDFHERVIKIGPVPFPVLEKYIDNEYFTGNL